MGRKDSAKYHKSLNQQLYDMLEGMKKFGKSRNFLKKLGLEDKVITSISTYRTYHEIGKRFISFVQLKHPEETSLKKTAKYVPEYMALRIELYKEGKISAYTIKTEASALHKIFQIKPESSLFVHCPKADRTEIKRSRSAIGGSGNPFVDLMCRSTGLRGMKELEQLKGGCLYTIDDLRVMLSDYEDKLSSEGSFNREDHNQLNALKAATEHFPDFEFFVEVEKGKGGRVRFAPLCADKKDISIIVEKLASVPMGTRVFAGVSHEMIKNANTHAMRAEYAARIYHRYALLPKELEQLPKDKHCNGLGGFDYCSRRYVCRGNKSGLIFDRHALGQTAVALGHSYDRVLDVVNSYSYRF